MKIKGLKGVRAFISNDLWRVTEDEVSKPRGFFYNALKVIILSIQEFTQGRIINKASALTYSTILAIIPILAILFAIARGFGLNDFLEEQIRSGFEGQHQTTEIIFSVVNSYLTHAKNEIFIGVGLVLLLWSILTLTYNIERTFNNIWQVKKPRTLYRKITDYFSILVLLPIFFVLSSGISIFMSTFVKNMEGYVLLAPILKFTLRLIPFVFTWLMFICLYVYIPNTKVKVIHAIFPGIVAGTAFQGFQYLYIGSQIWVSRYNAIYGSFAAIPMFLLWTQISWSICLYGAELCYVAQNLKNYSFSKETANISRRYHDFLCILILSLICKRFENNEKPYTAEDLSTEHKIPIRLTKKILYELQDLELLCETPVDDDDEISAYLPALDIHKITVAMLFQRMDKFGSESFKIDREKYTLPWEALNKAKEEYYQNADKVLLKDL